MAHHKRRGAAPSTRISQAVAPEAPKSVASSTEASQASTPSTFLLSSRSRGRMSARGSMHGREIAKRPVTFLAPLPEDSASMYSSPMNNSRSTLFPDRSRLPSWAPPSTHTVGGGTFTGVQNSVVLSDAKGSWYGALHDQDHSVRSDSNHGSLFGIPSTPASTAHSAAQPENPFLGSSDVQSEYSAPSGATFIGGAGGLHHPPSAAGSLSRRVGDPFSSFSSAASTSHRSSHGMLLTCTPAVQWSESSHGAFFSACVKLAG
jgi:hypothetical protein